MEVVNFVIGFTLFVVVGVIIANISSKAEREEYKGFELLGCAQYVGGFSNILDRMNVTIRQKYNSLFIELDEKHNKKMIEISYKNIISIDGKTEEQITNDVTLGRIILLGVLALGFKKQNIKNRKFFILTYFDETNGKEQTLIFECIQAEKYINMFNNVIRANN